MKAPPWLVVPPGSLEMGKTLRLDPTEAQHVTASLRRKQGQRVVLVDGEGCLAEAVLLAARGRKVDAQVVEVRFEPRPEGPGLTLALGVVGNQAMDWAVQKSVELGVGCLQPMITERTQAHHQAIVGRTPHWRRVARQSLKQCRRAWAMEVPEPVSLVQVVDRWGSAGGVVADREGVSIHQMKPTMAEVLLVGPEGGLSASEMELLMERGWFRLRLGRHVLRADTAAVVGAALLIAHEREKPV